MRRVRPARRGRSCADRRLLSSSSPQYPSGFGFATVLLRQTVRVAQSRRPRPAPASGDGRRNAIPRRRTGARPPVAHSLAWPHDAPRRNTGKLFGAVEFEGECVSIRAGWAAHDAPAKLVASMASGIVVSHRAFGTLSDIDQAAKGRSACAALQPRAGLGMAKRFQGTEECRPQRSWLP
jgi:hypothetical protein